MKIMPEIKKTYVIMRSDLGSCLCEGECLIVSHNKEAIEEYAKPYCGVVKEMNEAFDILESLYGEV